MNYSIHLRLAHLSGSDSRRRSKDSKRLSFGGFGFAAHTDGTSKAGPLSAKVRRNNNALTSLAADCANGLACCWYANLNPRVSLKRLR